MDAALIRRLLSRLGGLALVLSLVSSAWATTDIEFNFRTTSGYVTDGANQTYDLGAAYPVTRAGFTFGWEHGGTGFDNSSGTRDRSNDTDHSPRLAGIAFASGGSYGVTPYFRVDLAAGTYNIYLGVGDQGAGGAFVNTIRLYDGETGSAFGTLLATPISALSINPDNFADAGGTIRTSAADWNTNGATVSIQVTTTGASLIMRLGPDTDDGTLTRVATIRIESAGGGGGSSGAGRLLLGCCH